MNCISSAHVLSLAVVLCLTQASSGGETVSFELDIQPILTKSGCNSGACHGKQRGQNGFQLSLLGFDSNYDFAAVTQGGRGRRTFTAAPEQSLLLRKATGTVPHGGGKRFSEESDAYQNLLAWIASGAERSVENEPSLVRVELSEASFLLAPNESGQLHTVAHYSNGSQRDVTNTTDYLSNQSAVVAVDESGKMVAGALPGETAIMVRYRNHICVANVVIPQALTVDATYYDSLTSINFIDELVYKKLEKTGVKPSTDASDAVFLRRVYTDLIGRTPSPAEARRFLDTESDDKRKYLVEELLDRPEYVDHWANQWVDLLRPNPYRVGIKAVLNYDNWIRQQFRDGVGYDRFVHSLLTAKGSTWSNGAVTLFRDRRSPDEVTTLVSQLFLGVRLECAKCHHHPFEKWSQDDFYQFAAYFGQVGYKGKGLSPPISGGQETVFVATKGDVKHPITGEIMQPSPLFGEAPVTQGEDRREALADWLISEDNEYFAKVQANRIWAALMGRGLVDPVDDLRSTNPPTNPALLDALASHFRQVDYDLKELLKTITASRVYGLSSTPSESNVGDRLNYSRHYRHRLRAEVLLDSMADITQTPSELSGMPSGSRANQVWTHRVGSMFLDTFGRPDPNQDPPCERTGDSTVTQSLHMMNSKKLDRRIRSDSGRAARLAASEMSSVEVVTELYLAIYSRYPSDNENSYASKMISEAGDDRRATIEDLMWAMLNTPEYIIQN